MNRFHVRTVAVLLIVAFASAGAFVLTDSTVPEAHADHGCLAAGIECLLALIDVADKCFGGNPGPDCLPAIFTAIEKCEHAANDCFG